MIIDEKAGIIKPNRPVILGPCLPVEIFVEKAQQVGAEVFRIKADQETVEDYRLENTKIARYKLKKVDDFSCVIERLFEF